MSFSRFHICSLIAACALLAFSCGSDDPQPVDPPKPVEPENPVDPEPEPEPEPEPTFTPEFIAGQLSIVTDGGAAITSKEDYVGCKISLTHSNEEWNFTDATAGVRGRGNSSWLWYDKKPYRIKFDKKQTFMGLAKAKSWVLLAEYRDPTDLMNAFVFEWAQLCGMPYTNHNRYVELTLNGDPVGLYHLTEQVQQNENRVAVDEKAGYLIQLDRDDGPELAPEATDNFWSTVYRMPVCVKNPEDLGKAGLETAAAELAVLERAVSALDYDAIKANLDVKTMIDFLIIQEFVYNVELDAPRSMYMHKDVGGKWAMGPLWDFDAGFDFDWGQMYTGHTFFTSSRELVMGTSPATHAGTQYRVPGFFSDLFKIPGFVKEYKARWIETSPLIEQAWATSLKYYNANTAAWQRDADRWPIDKKFGTEIRRMETWLTARKTYLDTVIKNYPD